MDKILLLIVGFYSLYLGSQFTNGVQKRNSKRNATLCYIFGLLAFITAIVKVYL